MRLMSRGALLLIVCIPYITAWSGTGCANGKELQGPAGCILCPAGTFSLGSDCGSIDCPGCTSCPAGAYQSASSMSHCTQCAEGSLSNSASASSCLKFNPGTFSSNGTTVTLNCLHLLFCRQVQHCYQTFLIRKGVSKLYCWYVLHRKGHG